MRNSFTTPELSALPKIISTERFATYIAARADITQALALYQWNAQISAAFMFPLHVYEICIRNAAANAIAHFYGPDWTMVGRI